MTDADETSFPLPELMRGLRAYGSSRAMPGPDHDRFFAPLIEAVRGVRAAHARALASGAPPWRCAETIDATRAAAQLRATLVTFAAERHPQAPPDRRALEAELLDEAEVLFHALDALSAAAQQVLTVADGERVDAWHVWTARVTTALGAADACWARAVVVLRDAPLVGKGARAR